MNGEQNEMEKKRKKGKRKWINEKVSERGAKNKKPKAMKTDLSRFLISIFSRYKTMWSSFYDININIRIKWKLFEFTREWS